jgi:hypothetical protein
MDALHRSWQRATEIAAIALVVDAKDEAAAALYRHFDFNPLHGDPRRLYMPLKKIAALFRQVFLGGRQTSGQPMPRWVTRHTQYPRRV